MNVMLKLFLCMPRSLMERWRFIIIIIIIIIFIYCNCVVTRWQWLFYMHTKFEIGC